MRIHTTEITEFSAYKKNFSSFFMFMVFAMVSLSGYPHVSLAQGSDSLDEAVAIENELKEIPTTNPEQTVDIKKNKVAASESNEKKHKNRTSSYIIFDDKKLLDGYKKKYSHLSKEILLEMIKDYNLNSYKSTAAVMVFIDNFSKEVVSKEKRGVEKILLRRLARTDSPFLQVEIMYALCCLDRYRYYKSMVPGLIQKLNHYNSTVNEIAFDSMENIIKDGNNRAREARIVFNTLRKILFLSRRRLNDIKEPGPKLTRKLKLLRWSIKILGRQELRRLPEEVLPLL